MTRLVKRITPKDMEQYMDIYLNAYPAGKDLSDECREKYLTRNMESLKDFDDVNFYGLFEDDKLIAQAKFIDFNMNLFGKMSKGTGLMALGVHPLEKKKGAAKDMVLAFEKYAKESGSKVAMLLPFRIDFYRNMGYGLGTKMDEYHIETVNLPKLDRPTHVRFVKREEAGKMLDCHKAFVHKTHGACYKFREEVRDFVDDEGRWLGYFDGEELKGYAIFDFENVSETNYTINQMVVRELVYTDGEVLKELLSAIRMQADLAQTVIFRVGEPDFHNILASPQYIDNYYIDFGFLKTNVGAIGTMYKIVDIEGFIKDTSYRKFVNINLNVGFKVYDELLHETKEFVMQFKDGKYAYLEKGERDLNVSIKLSDFSSLMMGSSEFAGLARIGAAKVDNEDYIQALDALFHAQQKPFTNTDY